MNQYEKQYCEGGLPDAYELAGAWKVTVLSGHLPNMLHLGHIKVIKLRKGKLRGYNRILLLIRWWRFRITFSKDCARFEYRGWQFFDKVRRVNRDHLIGQYKFINRTGKFELGGYFEMRRKD